MDRLIKLATYYLNPPKEALMIGVKIAGPSTQVRVRPDEGHLLISAIDPAVRYGPYNWPVLSALPVGVVDPDGKPIDIDGNQPPLNGRDQCYLVDDPTFGCAALALRSDCDVMGASLPTPTKLAPGIYEVD